MSTLTIAISDDVLKRLQQRAISQATTPEIIAANDVATASSGEQPGDRLRRWVGAFDLGVSDAGSKHDKYIGEGTMQRKS